MDQNTKQHLAVLTHRFRGTGGIINRHFVETLDALYGPGLIRRHFHLIYDAVMRTYPNPHLVGPDSILAVSFFHQHGLSEQDFREIEELSYEGLVRARAVTTMVSNGGHGPLRLGVLFMSRGGNQTAPTPRLPADVLLTPEDGAWAHDQILEKGPEFLYGLLTQSTSPASPEGDTVAARSEAL